MNETTKEILKGLQSDLDRIKLHESNIEVLWSLDYLIKNIKQSKKEIIEGLELNGK